MDQGFTDREITDKIIGHGKPQQSVNIACRDLESRGLIHRKKRHDGKIGNYLSDSNYIEVAPIVERQQDGMSEDEIKEIINNSLLSKGWKTQVAWAKTLGIDIDAFRGNERWIIEVKGCGSRDAMRANYFVAILGETLQRMSDPNAKYSIAFPDMQQYRNLWNRLPRLAKERTGISVLFVNEKRDIEEVI
ncbi:MarR family transcriptional regulator [Bacillus sp. sid0103]|nr:MarR family transcriptional regulator [Bacillus sp. sid0103]